MTPRLFVRQAAKADVAAAFQWYELHRVGLGVEFSDEVGAAYAAIEKGPQRFPVKCDDIRMALVRRFPYVVYFVVLPRHISVIAVLHGHRNPQVWQQRR
ncbi:MAG: type II toxin-antitoxin system RelE/ParE family toxin [Gemmatimonadota bacterium]|nr:type II toxin-antitoxin system RelE/ParE family toxin [Gemmatimonadota bacterium]